MKTSLLALTLAALIAGCSSMQQQPSTAASGASGSGFNAHMCQSLKSYMGRGEDDKVQEACMRQLGADGCKQCMSGM